VGEWLRQRREELGLDLEQVEADTRIRARYVEALENETWEAMPDAIVGRGFLRNYTAYLELDPQNAPAGYAEFLASAEPESLAVEESSPFAADTFRPLALHSVPGQRSRWVLLLGLAVVLVVALALLAWWGYPRIAPLLPQWQLGSNSPTATPTERISSAALPTKTQTPTTATSSTSVPKATTATVATTATTQPTRGPTRTASPSPSPSTPVYTGIFMELFFTGTSWIQVTVDGVREFQGELETDTYRSWYGEERIELRVGNAGAVRVVVNGENLGYLGEEGEVLDRVFEVVEGEISEATVTPVPTGEATEEPTATLTAVPTPSPTTQPTVAPPAPEITPTLTITPTVTITPALTITPTANP
jgi:cytoskeletal protein RodZ